MPQRRSLILLILLAIVWPGFRSFGHVHPPPEPRPFWLPWAASDATFDEARSRLYLTSSDRREVQVIDLSTGLATHILSFDLVPESLAMSPDGSTLFVALLTRAHSSSWRDETHEGYIARVDLETVEEEARLHVATDPFDLVATSDGPLIVSSGSGGWTSISVIDEWTGEILGSASIYQQARLALHPSETTVYAATTLLGPSSIDRFDLLPDGGIELRWRGGAGSVSTQPLGNVFASPLGDLLFTRGGSVYTAGPSAAEDLNFFRKLTDGQWNDWQDHVMEDVHFDASTNLAIAAQPDGIHYYNLLTLEPFAGDLGIARWVGVAQGQVYAVAIGYSSTEILAYPHPAPDGGSNTPPTLVASFAPGEDITTLTEVVYDAAGSFDLEDPPEALVFRFDLGDDGGWDTEFGPEPALTHRWGTSGAKRVRVQVRDALGLTDEIVLEHAVVFEPDPGWSGLSHPAFELPFAMTDAIFDAGRSRLYVSDAEDRRVHFVDLETGLIIRTFDFNLEPGSLAMTHDGSRLYVGLVEHAGYRSDAIGQEGAFARFDLNRGLKDDQHWTVVGPIDLAAQDGGLLAMGAAYYLDHGRLYADTGVELARSRARGRASFAFHPTRPILYSAAPTLSNIERLELLPGGGYERTAWTSDGEDDIWLSPDGGALVARNGNRFSAGADLGEDDLALIEDLGTGDLRDVYFDSTRHTVFMLGEDLITAFSLQSWLPFATVEFGEPVDRVGADSRGAYGLVIEEDRTRLLTAAHPAPRGDTNTAPVPAFSVSPDSGGTTLSEFILDASASTDAEDGSLRFRWDLDGDGVWDTGFSSDPTVEVRFDTGGTKVARVQALDSVGFASEASLRFDVVYQEDPAVPGDEDPRYSLPFVASDVAFDSDRGLLYATSIDERKLYFVDLATGFISKEVEFGLLPETLYLEPGGESLYVALLTAPHDRASPYPSAYESHVARIDLDLQSEVHRVEIAEDPGDFVLTPGGLFLVVSGSGGHRPVKAFDAETGAAVSEASGVVFHSSKLVLHPDGDLAYVCDYSVTRIAIHPDGTLSRELTRGDGRASYGLWIAPAGDFLMIEAGAVSTAGQPIIREDLVPFAELEVTRLSDVAFDALRNVIFASDSGLLEAYNLETFVPFHTFEFERDIDRVGSVGATVFAVAIEERHTEILTAPHPAPDGDTNTPPVADLVVSPESGGTTRDEFRLDASASSDPEDVNEALVYRWDLDDDGVWDTAFASEAARSEQYEVAGTKAVRVQVRDSYGLVADRVISFDVAFQADPGTPDAEPRYALPFPVTDAVFDAERELLYATSLEKRKLYAVDLQTRFVIREFDFDWKTESLAMTPDGSTLYVALLTRPHYRYWEEDHEGYVARVDLETLTKQAQYWINEDPADLVATDDGRLIVAGGSGYRIGMHSYDAATGAELGPTSSHHTGLRILLHPSQTILYGAPQSSNWGMHRYDIPTEGGVYSRWSSLDDGDHWIRGAAWPSPLGDVLVTRGGDVFSAAGTTREEDVIYQGSVSDLVIEDLFFDADGERAYSFESSGCSSSHYPCIREVTIRDLRTLEANEIFPVEYPGRFIGATRRAIFVVTESSGASTPLERISRNVPPVADAGVARTFECSGGGAVAVLDGSGSHDGNSRPGSRDDIVSFTWWRDRGGPEEEWLGEGEVFEASLPLGASVMTLEVVDREGETATSTVTHQVADTLPPSLALSVDPELLWPPDHRLQTVHVSAVAQDACDATPFVVLTSVASSAEDGPSGGSHSDPDIQGAAVGTPDFELVLRAEKGPRGAARDYTLFYTAGDASGHTTEASVRVSVPSSAGRNLFSAP